MVGTRTLNCEADSRTVPRTHYTHPEMTGSSPLIGIIREVLDKLQQHGDTAVARQCQCSERLIKAQSCLVRHRRGLRDALDAGLKANDVAGDGHGSTAGNGAAQTVAPRLRSTGPARQLRHSSLALQDLCCFTLSKSGTATRYVSVCEAWPYCGRILCRPSACRIARQWRLHADEHGCVADHDR